jgi:predicted nuclease of predicted toxin-antitoxin system
LPALIVDENIPRETRQWLVKKGFDVASVNQIYLKSAKDIDIAEYAVKNNFTIITLDNHFAQIYRMLKNNQLTIIIIKAKPAIPANIIQVLDIAHEKINLKAVKGKLVIISKNRIRIIT